MGYYTTKLIRTQLLAVLLLGLLLYPQTGIIWQLVWGVASFIFLLYVPGNWLSYIFFDAESDINAFERFIMSFALSLLVVVFGSFYLHYFGRAVYPIHIYTITVLVIAGTYLYLWLQEYSTR